MAQQLDDPTIYSKLDPTNLRQRLRDFPLQCRKAWAEAVAFDLPSNYMQANRVVVGGVGGSAIGGDLLADLASLEDTPLITVCRDYRIPSFVDENTLVLACSYSGETEETISCFSQAVNRGAKVVAVTSGGSLAAEAMKHGAPLFTVDYKGEPRSALPYSFLVPTALLMKAGLISDKTHDIEEAVSVLDSVVSQLAEEIPSKGNPAKEMAEDILDRLIVIYGAGIFSGLARRWKTQFNENSKAWAFFELLPEAHHNSVVGYMMPPEVKTNAFAILLQPEFLHPRTRLRYQITGDLLDEQSIPHRTVRGQGDSALSQILTAAILGDYTSFYLALLEGVSPSPVPNIDYIKGRLADSG